MIQRAIDFTLILNGILLISLVIGIRWWQRRHGRLAEKKVALIIVGFFSFSTLLTSLPLLYLNIMVTLIIDLIFLLVFWCIGYPWAYWLIRQFNKPKL